MDGGSEGLDVIERIVSGAPDRLEGLGWLAIEIGYDQAEAVRERFVTAGLVDIQTTRDGAGHERVIAGRAGG